VIEVTDYNALAMLLRRYTYSTSIFEKKRNIQNVIAFNNILIYDIDNDPKDPYLSISKAKLLLEDKNISAMIIPSKSNMIEKFTAKGKSKGIVERYRIIIPTKQAIGEKTNLEIYREFQRLVAIEIGVDTYVDRQALNDMARFYYP